MEVQEIIESGAEEVENSIAVMEADESFAGGDDSSDDDDYRPIKSS